jgi:predicted  nucleic acid-binding Zn-ribbon protein
MSEELARLRHEVAALRKRLDGLDAELRPVWQRENEIKASIKATHQTIGGQVVGLMLENRAARADLFAELDRLAETWGPVRKARRECKMDIDGAMRVVDAITRTDNKDAPESEPRLL